jgi:hypothetical protein
MSSIILLCYAPMHDLLTLYVSPTIWCDDWYECDGTDGTVTVTRHMNVQQ